MRIPPHHHDGEGTNASLHAFMTGIGHTPPTIIGLDRASVSSDVGRTVQRLRDRGIEPPLVDRALHHEGEPAKGIMIAAVVMFVVYMLIGIVRAYLSGRLS